MLGDWFWIRPRHFFHRLVGVRGNGRLVSSLFQQCIYFCIKYMSCNRRACYATGDRFREHLSTLRFVGAICPPDTRHCQSAKRAGVLRADPPPTPHSVGYKGRRSFMKMKFGPIPKPRRCNRILSCRTVFRSVSSPRIMRPRNVCFNFTAFPFASQHL